MSVYSSEQPDELYKVKSNLLGIVKDLIKWIESDLIETPGSRCFNYRYGLCVNIGENANDLSVELLFERIYHLWPEFSGNCNYPIFDSSDQIRCPGEQYDELNHYSGCQKQLRLELLAFVESRLKQELET